MAGGAKYRWIALAGAALGAACSPAEAPRSEAAAPAGPNVVEVVATEYAFAMPDTIPSGPTTFRLVDNGQTLHHVQLIRLEQGKTLADLAAINPEVAPPEWMVMVGGPNTPRPGGGVSEGTLDLVPGNYAVICVIPDPDGTQHVAKGMAHGLTVVPSTEARAMPEPDMTVTLADYSFTPSAPWAAGSHTIRVENAATQPHEIVIMHLAPGKTVGDLLAWVEKQEGPPPAEPMGGTTMLAPGGSQLVHLEMVPGEYALLCFYPDASDGKPHVAHGMMQQITVN